MSQQITIYAIIYSTKTLFSTNQQNQTVNERNGSFVFPRLAFLFRPLPKIGRRPCPRRFRLLLASDEAKSSPVL
jgi:hypothetical protein